MGGTTVTHEKKLSDRYYVLEAAYAYMLYGPGAVHDGGISAHVLPSSSEFTPDLLAAFADQIPPAVASDSVTISTDPYGAIDAAIDEATGKWVMLWSAKINEMEGDRAVVSIRYYVNDLAAADFTLDLLRKDGKWEVQSSRLDHIA